MIYRKLKAEIGTILRKLNLTKFARIYNMSRPTVYKYLKLIA